MNRNTKKTQKTTVTNKKKTALLIAAVAAVLAIVTVAIIFVYFIPRRHFKFKNGEIVQNNGTVYKMVVSNYRPTSYFTDELYAELDHPIYGKVPLYEVEGTNGAFLYCKEDSMLYRHEDVSVPSLEMFSASSILISTISDREMSIKDTFDKEIIEKYITLISNEENRVTDKMVTEIFTPDKWYNISFKSEEYPYLMYTLSYGQKGDSEFYIRDRITGYFYECGDEFYKLIKGADLPAESESETETKAPGVEI